MEDVKVILRKYLRAKKAPKNIKTFENAQRYAEDLGKIIADSLGIEDPSFLENTEDEIAEVLRMLLKHGYDDATAAAMIAQRIQNEEKELGLGILRGEFDPLIADTIAQQIAGKDVTKEYVENLIKQKTIGAVDDTIRKNAEARDNVGLAVRIIRRYSDVGLRAGTKYAEPCRWCMSRCGSWDNYADAVAAGCFERHPGCLCTIDYNVGKTHAKL